ncbi:MAG TPA: FlgD immunoglobulin-like domain containing protein, partial [Bacteroidales bacterium]
FDGSSCVGVLSYNGDNIVGIATGMSDSDTKIVGYNPGDKITMKVWKASQDQVIEPELVFSSNQSNIFSSRGTAVLELKAATTSASVDMKKVKVYPNPFTTQCTFDFTLDKLSTVKIDILDINGRTLAEVLNKDFDQGSYTITWDGKESNGTDVKEGAYLYRFSAGNLVITHPIIRINY